MMDKTTEKFCPYCGMSLYHIMHLLLFSSAPMQIRGLNGIRNVEQDLAQ